MPPCQANTLSAAQLTVGGDFHQPIPVLGDGYAWMEPIELNVEQSIIISDMDIYLDLAHTEVGDLRIFIDSPWGDTILLKDVWQPLWREPRIDMSGTVFDDEADLLLTNGYAPYNGCFRPEQSLSVFDGHDAHGRWTLRIYDGYLADYGTLDRWELRFNHTPEPGSLFYLVILLPYCLFKRDAPPK